jgi:pectate lyase
MHSTKTIAPRIRLAAFLTFSRKTMTPITTKAPLENMNRIPLSPRRGVGLLLTLGLLLSLVTAQAAVLLTEPFPTAYGNGTLLGTGVTNGGWNTKWTGGNSAGTGAAVCSSAGALQYASLLPIEESANYGLQICTATSRRLAAPFTSQSGDGTDVYLSFLIKVTAATPAARELIGFRNSTGGGNQAGSVGISATRQLTVYKNSSNASATHPTVLNVNETYYVVMRLRFQTGSDEVAVWLNPATGETDPANAGVTPTTTTANSDQSSVLAVQLPSVADASGALYLDEFRVTTSWAEATPAAGPIVPAKLTFTSPRTVATLGQNFLPMTVQVQTAGGLDAPQAGVPVTLSLASGTGSVAGTLMRNTDNNGRAVFDDISVNATGPKQFTATPSGAGAGWSAATSANFWVLPAANAAPASSPVITQSIATAGNFIMRGRDGAPNSEYQILSATNVTFPMNSWAAVATNNFDANGHFGWTNPIVPGGPRFFRVSGQGASGDGGQFQHVGYASVPAPITGAGNTTNILIATNLAEILAVAASPDPWAIYIEGTVTLRTTGNTYFGPNKSIIGLGTNATLIGDIGIFYTEGSTTYAATNIIIRNLTLTNPDGYGEDDCITIKNGGRQVWVDHCTMTDTPDGLMDITREADFVTVSWCKFYYSAPTGHENIILVGGNDGDSTDNGKLHVSVHHNWFGDLIKERVPSVRYGRAHVFNNYYNSPGNHYCARTRLYAEVLVENNHFENVYNPWELATSTAGPNGLLRATGNITNNCTFATDHYAANLPNSGVVVLVDGSDTLTAGDPLGLNPPPYSYTPAAANDVAAMVQQHAGAGKGPFAP